MDAEAARKRAEYLEKMKANSRGQPQSQGASGRASDLKSAAAKEAPSAKGMSEEEKRAQFLASWKAKQSVVERSQLKSSIESKPKPKSAPEAPAPVVAKPAPIEVVQSVDDDNFESLPTLQRSFSLTYDDPVPGPAPQQTDILAALESHVVADSTSAAAPSGEAPKRIGKRKLVEAVEEEVVENTDPNTAFSPSGLLFDGAWNSLEKPVDQVFTLTEFNSPLQHQTLALRLTLPKNAAGWSMNITPEQDLSLSDIYFHFNPRYKKGFIMQNDRQGTWGQPLKAQIEDGNHLRAAAIKASKMELVVQVRREGFAVFINGVFCVFFMHRRDLFAHAAGQSVGHLLTSSSSSSSSSGSGAISRLKLIIPAKDGNGNPEEIIVNQVWWGHTDHSLLCMPAEMESRIKMNFDRAAAEAASRAADIAGRTIAVSGLPVSSNLVDLQSLEYLLFDLFAEFTPETISVPPGQGLAFVRLISSAVIQSAIDALNGAIIGEADDNGEGQSTLLLTRMMPGQTM